MDKQLWAPAAEAIQPLRHGSTRWHDEDVRCVRLFGLAQPKIEHVWPEVWSRITASRNGKVGRTPGEEMEPESERTGAGLAPVGGAAEVGDVPEMSGIDGDGGIHPEQLEISILEKCGH